MMTRTGLLALGLLAVAAWTTSAQDKTLYNFENGTQGWWKFAGGGASVGLSAGKPAVAASQALKIVYKFAGAGSYLGIGVQPKWAFGGNDDMSKYAAGAISISMQCDAAVSVRIELRMSGKQTYSYTTPKIGKTLTVYTIPFSDFKSKGNPLDLKSLRINQIVLIPKGGSEEHTLYIDDVKFLEATPAK